MTTFKTFEDIEVWKESRVIVRMIREICKRSSVKRDYNFIDQITRSARSISANIAEGNDCMFPDAFAQFLGYSKRSAAEVRSHLYDALDENYISKEEFDDLVQRLLKISKMLSKLMSYLNGLQSKNKRIAV